MTGNSLNEFINDLYFCSEKEIVYHGDRYIVSGYAENDEYVLEVVNITIQKSFFEAKSRNRSECVEKFEKADIFDGKNIYEVESEIKVIFG